MPIVDHPRSVATYGELGDQLRAALGDHEPAVFYHKLEDLWMTPWIEQLAMLGHNIRHSTGDNPAKNSMEYHAVQHNKFEWLQTAAERDVDAETLIWLDYGCMLQPGFNKELLQAFLNNVRANDLAIPGCWPKRPVVDHYPCWRFCGTLFVVPRSDIWTLNRAFKAMTKTRVRTTANVSWEVNDLAHMELVNLMPNLRWYQADHNATMLTGY